MLTKRIIFSVRRKSNPVFGRGRLFETITVEMNHGESKQGATRMAQELAYGLLEHFDEAEITWQLGDDPGEHKL